MLYLGHGEPFTVGQMTQGCVECSRAHRIGSELGSEGLDAVLGPLTVLPGELSIDSESGFRCPIGAVLRIKKTDRSGLVISYLFERIYLEHP